MRSAVKFLLHTFSAVLFLIISFVQLLLFMYFLRSEGPHLLFLIWFLSALFFTFLYYSLSKQNRLLKTAAGLCAAFIVFAGIITVLIQVQVTKRSLAEAWLELARSGGAFGFFSFFASEIYALFIFVQAVFFSQKKYVSYAFSISAAAGLCYGIIFHKVYLLVPAVLLCLPVYIFYTPLSLAKIRDRFFRMLFPLSSTVFLSCITALFVWMSPDPSIPSIPIDVTPLVQRISPQFPLLTSIPGYGFSTSAQKMPRSTYLTTRSLFEVNGTPLSIHYLMTERFVNWRGTSWSKDTSGKDAEIPVSILGDDERLTSYQVSDSVLLTLLEDFYTSFPVKADTVEIRIPKTLSSPFTSDEADALLFEQSVKRGTQVLLLQSKEKFYYTEEELHLIQSQAVNNYTAVYEGSGQWKTLVQNLLAQSVERSGRGAVVTGEFTSVEKRAYLEILLEYFSEGFTYSLSTDAPVSVQNPIEHFLFESKKGFCIYYASSFVLLAREAGIPARLVEGFRVQLDETGKGRITGSSAHAWSEIWIDGQWRIFEPTPAFMSGDPFAYVRENDRNTRIQLEQLFHDQTESGNSGYSLSINASRFFRSQYKLILLILLCVTLSAALLLFLMRILRSADKKTKRRARILVKKYVKKNIDSPEKSGWLEWKKAVSAFSEEDAQTADDMITIIYSGR